MMLVDRVPEHPFSLMPTSTRSSAAERRFAAQRWRRDLAVLRQILAGESAVDLNQLWFTDRESVDHFLRLHQFDTDNPLDVGRLRDLLHEAVEYLTESFRFDVPDEIAQPEEIHDLFLLASSGSAKFRRYACMALKVMHITHHLNGRELVYAASISEAQILDRLNTRVFTTIDALRATGIDVVEFSGGKKSRASLVTKLLAKRSTLASQIFDRMRYSITVRTRDDLVRALLYLSRHIIPFNCVFPEQSQNGIITLGDIARVLNVDPQTIWEAWMRDRPGLTADGSAPTPPNEFSGTSYRCVNFVADIPLRIDDAIPEATPAIAFAQTEIQLVDEETARANNEGENAHSRYKKRQTSRVKARLEGKTKTELEKAD